MTEVPDLTSNTSPIKGMESLGFEFSLPPELEAGEPPEARGLRRDQVRLMVSNYSTDRVRHASFHDLPKFLTRGDVLVINTSRTRNAALLAVRADGTRLELHLSTHLMEEYSKLPSGEAGDLWTIELRSLESNGKSRHFEGAEQGEILSLPGAAAAVLLGPYISDCDPDLQLPSQTLWLASVTLPSAVDDYLAQFGFPIRYNYVKDKWPLSYYQTVYATESGSAEMPSAGRPFTSELLMRLESKGVQIAPLILHTGVSNVDTHEPPYKEFYQVSSDTARLVNEARASGRRVIAVGTTVVRALETVTAAGGKVHAGEGWTCKVITPKYKLRSINALLTGYHEPEATHLAILQALVGPAHTRLAYNEALKHNYLWHEFGDLHLMLP
jgi:S-adenosylmethionine:tRNA ribosyltransferase-isomerase